MASGQTLLTVAIPIYNRRSFLERILGRFLEEKDLFTSRVELFISDNASEEDIPSLVEEYRLKGLPIRFNRNEKNLGPDGNFEICFREARGRYLWLLGSDDCPSPGALERILSTLEECRPGLLHLRAKNLGGKGLQVENDPDIFLEKMDVLGFVTFISANIVRTASVQEVDFRAYHDTNLIQVPLYLDAIYRFRENATLGFDFLDEGNDAANNGGFKFFKVFAGNLLSILHEKVDDGNMSSVAYAKIKKNIFKDLVAPYSVDLLIRGKGSNFSTDDGWAVVKGNFGMEKYFYPVLAAEYLGLPRLYGKVHHALHLVKKKIKGEG